MYRKILGLVRYLRLERYNWLEMLQVTAVKKVHQVNFGQIGRTKKKSYLAASDVAHGSSGLIYHRQVEFPLSASWPL